MKTPSIAAVLAASIAVTAPVTAAADAKDALIGGIVGAIIQKSISDHNRQQQQQRAQPKKVYKQKSTSTKNRVYTAPSLNSQYSRSERMQIQTALGNLGYRIGSIDGVLGKNSRRVIRQFQASRGEAQTGQLTRAQYVALVSTAPGVAPAFARRELNRDEVVLMQQGLQRLGFYTGRIDGAKGPGTRGALAAFLAQNGMNAARTTPVQGLVMARNAAGLPTPPYLQQEANTQMAGLAPATPFGTPQTQPGMAGQMQAGFGAPAQQATPFGAPAQGQQPLFGAPAQPQSAFGAPTQQPGTQPQMQVPQGQMVNAPANPLFGAQPQAGAGQVQPTPVFGAPATQPAVPQNGVAAPAGQNLFAPAAQQPQLQQQQQVPQSAPANTLFATGVQPAAPGTQPVTQPVAQAQIAPQQPQSTLDIFSATGTPQPQQATGQAQLAPAQASSGNALFGTTSTQGTTTGGVFGSN